MNMTGKWQSLKKWGKRGLILFAVLYIFWFLLWFWPRPIQCPIERHTFEGKAFDIELCYRVEGNRDYGIGIGVYSTDGKLLAWRGGTFSPESPLNYLSIEDDKIRYSDDTSDLSSASIPEDCVLHMPPTWVDWLDYRLPGGVPFLNHCGRVSDEISDNARKNWRIRIEPERNRQEAERSSPPEPAKPKSGQ